MLPKAAVCASLEPLNGKRFRAKALPNESRYKIVQSINGDRVASGPVNELRKRKDKLPLVGAVRICILFVAEIPGVKEIFHQTFS